MDLTARQAVLATVAVLAVAVAAATLPNPVADGTVGPSPVPDFGIGGSGGSSGGEDGGFSFGLGGDVAFRGICLPFLLSRWFLTGAVLALLLGAYILYRRTDIIATIGFYGLFLPPAILLFVLLTDCGTPQPEPDQTASPLPAYNISFLFQGNASSGSTGGGSIPTAIPSFALALGVLAIVVLLVFLRVTGDDPAEEAEAEPAPEPEVSLARVGASAGRAADRIEDEATLENEIFRAWREMTDLLDLPRPASTTPREFADSATAAGMEPDHVEELTRLFEESRYGGIEPTADREERALEILRRIESAYAESSDTAEFDAEEVGPGTKTDDTGGDDAGP